MSTSDPIHFKSAIPPTISENHIVFRKEVLDQILLNLKETHLCLVTGKEKSGKTWLCYALGYIFTKEMEDRGQNAFVYFFIVGDDFDWRKAWDNIEDAKKSGFSTYFIIENCHRNIEGTSNLLARIISQGADNLWFVFTLQCVDNLTEIDHKEFFRLAKEKNCAIQLKPSEEHISDIINRFIRLEKVTTSISEVEIKRAARKWSRHYNLERVYTYLRLWKQGKYRTLDQVSEDIHDKKVLRELTVDTLRTAEEEGQQILKELKEIKNNYGATSEEYLNRVNAKAFIAHSMEWRHLYMDEYGAFPRLEKENLILDQIEKNIQKLLTKGSGLLIHVISGDSGSGKSAAAKLVIRRLIDQESLGEFQVLLGALPSIRIFEIEEINDWETLEEDFLSHLQSNGETSPIHLIYLHEDLFNLAQEDFRKLLAVLAEASSTSHVYLLTTSPSWIFGPRDLDKVRKQIALIDINTTKMADLDKEDRRSLKEQYLKVCEGACRPDLLKTIENEEESLMLLKLALHQNLTYSEYLESLFSKLSTRQPKYLAALLLSSTLARFYVHLPVTLIEELNKDLRQDDRLPVDHTFYSTINEKGLKLFKIRLGSRSEMNPKGLPDTIAPFHDRVAQVIYNAWPGDNNVPVFECKLWELSNRVYLKLDASDQTQPLLANVFRGHLRVASDQELNNFVAQFGPVRRDEWIFFENIESAYRWISYLGYNSARTQALRLSWRQVLSRAIRKHPEKATGASLALVLLGSKETISQEHKLWIEGIVNLNQHSFPFLLGVLDVLIQQQKFLLLGTYLTEFEKWLSKFSTATRPSFYRYSVLSTLRKLRSHKIATDKPFHDGLASIVKGYLMNIASEYATNDLLAWIKLNAQIRFGENDIRQLSKMLFEYSGADSTKFRPVLFEQLLRLVQTGNVEMFSPQEILNLYWQICAHEKDFRGLTFTSKELFGYLTWVNKKNHLQFREIVAKILSFLLADESAQFARSVAYPDFLSHFLYGVKITGIEIKAEQIRKVLRPLLTNFADPQPAAYVFAVIGDLRCPDIESMFPITMDHVDKQIRLCMAKKLGLSLEELLKDFTELLEEGEITLPTRVCIAVTDYAETKDKNEMSDKSLCLYQQRLYNWLRNNREAREARLVLPLVTLQFLFSGENLTGLEEVAIRSIQEGFVPFRFMDWWLREEAPQIHVEQRHPLLDAFWHYALQHSNLKKEGDEHYLIYKRYFLYLLENYPVTQDKAWWGRAIEHLLEYYDALVSSVLRRDSASPSLGRSNDSHMMYHQRLCLDEVMEVVLHSCSKKDDVAYAEFAKSVTESVFRYKNELWALRWLAGLNSEICIDGTKIFLEYLISIEERPQRMQSDDVFNHCNWWIEWITATRRDKVAEVRRLWQWVDNSPPRDVSIFLIPALLKTLPQVIHLFPPQMIITEVVGRDATFDFEDKSRLISDYLIWLEHYGEKEQKVDTDKLCSMLEEYLETLRKHLDRRPAVYGFQRILHASLRYNLIFQRVEIKDIFFAILERTVKMEEGGNIARHYFAWLFDHQRDITIYEYLEWVKRYSEEPQTPYVLMHLVRSLSVNGGCFRITIGEVDGIWDILKLFLSNRLEHDGSTIAAAEFLGYLAQFKEVLCLSNVQLDKVAKELFEVCRKQRDNPRVIYLLTGFDLFWNRLVDNPSAYEIVDLWQSLLPVDNRYADVFGKFTRKLNSYLEHDQNVELRRTVYEKLIHFVESKPEHQVSPKMAKIVILGKHYLADVSRIFPKLLHGQANLSELYFSIPLYLRSLSENQGIERCTRYEYEKDILRAIEANLHKPFSDICLSSAIEGCTRKVHYEQVTRLVEKYMKVGGGSDKNYWQPLEAYHKYQAESGIDNSSRRDTVRRFLAIIREGSRKEQSHRYLSSILRIWELELIPLDSLIETVRLLILSVYLSRSRRVKIILENLKKLVGPDLLLCPEVTLGTALKQIRENKEQGLMDLKRQFASPRSDQDTFLE